MMASKVGGLVLGALVWFGFPVFVFAGAVLRGGLCFGTLEVHCPQGCLQPGLVSIYDIPPMKPHTSTARYETRVNRWHPSRCGKFESK